MTEVTLVFPLGEGRAKVTLPGVPRLSDQIRFYGDAGPRLVRVEDVIWDTESETVEVWVR